MQLCTSTSRYPGKEGAHSSCLPPPLSSDTQHPLPAFHSYLYTLPKVVALTRRQLLPSLSCFTFFSLVLHSSPSFSLLSLPLFSLLLSPCPHILCLPMFSNKHVARFISFHRQRCVCLAVCVCVRCSPRQRRTKLLQQNMPRPLSYPLGCFHYYLPRCQLYAKSQAKHATLAGKMCPPRLLQ